MCNFVDGCGLLYELRTKGSNIRLPGLRGTGSDIGLPSGFSGARGGVKMIAAVSVPIWLRGELHIYRFQVCGCLPLTW